MPMCDAYIPKGALDPGAEEELVMRVSRLLADHEMRRIRELMEDPDEIEGMKKRAYALAWSFVHHPETYFAASPTKLPIYKFVASIPEGQIDDQFRSSVVADIVSAVAEAEGNRHPFPEARTWVFIHEVPDGNWGAGGRIQHLGDIVDFVAPGWGESAVARFRQIRSETAVEPVRRADGAAATR